MRREIGFIGLGRMGLPMAVSLINAGYTVNGFDPRTMDRFVAAGGKPAGSPREAASGQEFIISCLPGSADILRDVLSGPGGLLPALDAGAILIETSTHPVDAKRWAAERLAERGAVLLECEITGVPTMVAARQCVFFISGGSPAAFQRCLPVFDAITTTQKRYLGPLGTATKMKLVNNLLTCVHVAVAAEALALGIKAGLDPEAMLALFGAGAGSSLMFTQRGPLMAARKFDESDGHFDSLAKLPPAIQALADDTRAATPMLDAAARLFALALEQGRGPQDVAAMIEVIESLDGRHRGAGDLRPA
jgi:3-hydroxyisobutyrate dehydrogenase-like beta-hydroxyacid dehydrogenase